MLQDQEGIFINRYLLLIVFLIAFNVFLNVNSAYAEDICYDINQSDNCSNVIPDSKPTNNDSGSFNNLTYNDTNDLNLNSIDTEMSAAGSEEIYNFNLNQIKDAASTLRIYIDNNHKLPNYVLIGSSQMSTPQFLELLTTALLQINKGNNNLIPLREFSAPTSPRENIHAGNIPKAEFLKIANDIKNYMDSSGKTPDFAYGTSLGTFLRFENLVYMYTMILDYYNSSGKMADFAMMEPWSVIVSKPVVDLNAPKFTVNQIKDAASRVRSSIETDYKLPDYVLIGSSHVTMSQFLELLTTALLQINNGNSNLIPLRNFTAPLNPIENIHAGNIPRAEFLKIANDIKNYMDSSGKTPEFAYQTSLGTYLRFENLVYMYSMILDYHNTSGKMADFAIMKPWCVVKSPVLTYLTVDQVKNAASTLRQYIESYNKLPTNLNIGNWDVNMSQFLEILATATIQINNRNNNPIPLRTFNAPTSPREDIHAGNIYKAEYLKIAGDIKNYMDSSGKTPDFAYGTSLGTFLRFENLVYMYSMIMDYYNTSGNVAVYAAMRPWSKYDYHIEFGEVSAEGKCSCSLYTDYNVHTGTYVNYCPYCQKYGTLTYTNQQGCPEGMFYCDMCKGGCDADFCIVHGKAHTNTNVKFLTPA